MGMGTGNRSKQQLAEWGADMLCCLSHFTHTIRNEEELKGPYLADLYVCMTEQ